MELLGAIEKRRSIRKYKGEGVPRPMIEAILRAGSLAPSAKNRQPWRFIVVSGASKAGLLEAMEKGLERERTEPFLPGSAPFLGGAEQTLRIMRQAPVLIAVVNPLGSGFGRPLTDEQRIYESCNAQSVGAAIENMTLTAAELGLGSLWICDSYFAYRELYSWLHADGELMALLAVGYAEEAPAARPRKPLEELAEWRD